ncbi:MAG: response regulator [Calditrichia bacterium]
MNEVKRLLIVDDEETLTFSLYQTFINAPIDCEVVTASSSEEAITHYEASPFDILITDISMPGLNGLDLLAHLKALNKELHAVVITAYGSDERKQDAYAKGADWYVEKPFDIHELKQHVLTILG